VNNDQDLGKMAKLITKLWALSSSFRITEEEAKERAIHWLDLFGPDIFNERLRYKVATACEIHKDHGKPILAPEFFQVSEMVNADLLWTGNEWIPLSQAQTTTWNSDSQFKEIRANQIPEDEKQAILTEINRRIYGGR